MAPNAIFDDPVASTMISALPTFLVKSSKLVSEVAM